MAKLAPTQRVLSEALARFERSGLRGHTLSWLTGRLRVSVNSGTPILTITGVDRSERVASAVSTAETDALVSVVHSASTAAIPTGSTTTRTTTKTTTATETVAPTGGVRLVAFSRAETDRVTIGTTRDLLIGAIAGLLVGFFFVAQLLSTRPVGVGVPKPARTS